MSDRPLKILFASHIPYSRKLGATKVLLELGDELEKLGWTCRYDGPEEIAGAGASAGDIEPNYHLLLRDHLLKHAGDFDVVDYDHQYLPFDRSLFPSATLLVARSVLFAFHFENLRFPQPITLKSLVKKMIVWNKAEKENRRRIAQAYMTLTQADLINVCCRHDEAEMQRRGIGQNKTIVMPFGLGADRLPLFDVIQAEIPPGPPVIGFVGTFDYRKGCLDLSRAFSLVQEKVPKVRLRLMGTKGLFQTAKEVERRFPKPLREFIEVVPTFSPNDLPRFLADCSVGVFPSYVEGFPNGVLEMLSAALPVVAYRAPGPPDMVADDWLVERGDIQGLAEKLSVLLLDRQMLAACRLQAKTNSRQFNWPDIAKATDRLYRAAIDRLASPQTRSNH